MTRVSSALLLFTLVGCKSGVPDQPDASAPASEPVVVSEAEPEATDAPAGTADAPAGEGKVACHLDCSGQERTAYGPSEEEARAAAQELVSETCRPEDGQFFIVCDPPPGE